jgi:hypothetical protein
LGLGQSRCGDSLAADEWLRHGGSVPGCAPTVTSAVHTSTSVRRAARSDAKVRLAAQSSRRPSPGSRRRSALRCRR